MATENGGSASRIEQTAGKLASYRDWVAGHSRGGRGLILIGVFALLLVFGWATEPLQATIGSIPTQVVLWTVLLFMLYTLYALGRSVVENVRG